jgi:2-methylisocitrate lyase-like PEP mutase family enzyme
MAHIAEIAQATNLPISADLENGFDDSPDGVVETIALAAIAGAVGGSIEDASGRPDHPIYGKEHAAERIRAAAEAARALPFAFMLTARAENYLHGRPDLADTIARLQAYQAAGADVLYAPGLTSREDIAAVVRRRCRQAARPERHFQRAGFRRTRKNTLTLHGRSP